MTLCVLPAKRSQPLLWSRWFTYCFLSATWRFSAVVTKRAYTIVIRSWRVLSAFYSVVNMIQRFLSALHCCVHPPQWGAADAEIKVPSGENTELKRSPFHAWSRSVYSHTCYAYCQEFLSCLFLPFLSIHLHFFQNLSQFFPVLACRIKYVTLLDAGSRVECPRHINRLKKHDLWKDDDLWNDIWLGVTVKFVFSPDVILCGWLG